MIASSFASLPFAHLLIPEFPAWLLVIAYGLLGWCTYRLTKTKLTKTV